MNNLEKIFARHLSKPGEPSFFFDVDGTLKETDKRKYPNRFNPALPGLLYRLQQLGSVGINTDQPGAELHKFKQRLDAQLPTFESSLTGPYLLEGGHVLVPKYGSLLTDNQILIDQESINEISEIYKLLVAVLVIEQKWISVGGLPTDIMLPPHDEQGHAAKIIFEKGPAIDDPRYNGEYAEIEKWITNKAQDAGYLLLTDLLEAGNGTIRIIKKGVNKGTGFTFLESTGIDLSRVIYSGDQKNELPAVKEIKDSGGIVVLPSNHYADLKQYADYISDLPASDGIVQMFSTIP